MSKRTAADAFDVSSAPNAATTTAVVTEWVPSGEDPAEREKRIKREKRAQKLREMGMAGDGGHVSAVDQGDGWGAASGAGRHSDRRGARQEQTRDHAGHQGGCKIKTRIVHCKLTHDG